MIPGRPRFYDLCKMYSVDGLTLQALSDKSGVPESVVEAMFLDTPVKRADAEKVLAAFSQITGYTRNLENTRVALTPEVQ